MEVLPQGVPDGALAVVYYADNGKHGTYYLWKVNLHRGEQLWCWYALGKDGEEGNAYEATLAARKWIRDGVHTLGIRATKSES
jgi:hypothetical protein